VLGSILVSFTSPWGFVSALKSNLKTGLGGTRRSKRVSGKSPKFRSRRKSLAIAAALLGGAFVLWVAVNTAASAYGGLGSHRNERRVQSSITAHVLSCTRRGPISLDGAGYWWHCRATVPLAGGGTAEAVLGPSVAYLSDVGHDITVQSDCDNNGGDCNYGNDDPQWLGGLIQIAGVVVYGGGAIVALIGLGFLYDAVRGIKKPAESEQS